MLPLIKDYANYLNLASKKFGITLNDAIKLYGTYTVEKWEKLLNN